MKPVLAITCCNIHGTMNSKNHDREVRVQMPATKRQKTSGCPACKKDKKITQQNP